MKVNYPFFLLGIISTIQAQVDITIKPLYETTKKVDATRSSEGA